MVERCTRCRFDLDQSLAKPAFLELERAMMAVGIVAGPAKKDVGGPCAARAAFVGVVARAAVAPEILDGSVAHHAELFALVPDLTQRLLANVAPDVLRRGERRAAA